jgi:hypothetical protein
MARDSYKRLKDHSEELSPYWQELSIGRALCFDLEDSLDLIERSFGFRKLVNA